MDMKHVNLFLTILFFFALAGFLITFLFQKAEAPGAPTACTMEEKVCPDGSTVGRTGPQCTFAPCPAVSTASSTGDKANDQVIHQLQ